MGERSHRSEPLLGIKKILQFIASLRHSFSVLLLTETWATDANQSLLIIPGYSCVMKPHANRIGGGVAIYVKDILSYSVRNDINLINCDNVDFAFVQLIVGECNFTVGVIYRPPDQDLTLFNIAYSKLLDKLEGERNECFIGGDFNIKL